MKKAVLAIIFAAMILSLCACGKSGNSEDGAYSLISEPLPLPSELSDMRFLSMVKGRAFYYTAASEQGGENNAEQGAKLYSADLDGDNLKKLDKYEFKIETQEQFARGEVLRLCAADGDSLWVYERVSVPIFELPEDFDGSDQDKWQYQINYDQSFFVRKIGPEGEELFVLDLQKQMDESPIYINDISASESGELFLCGSEGRVCCFTTEGKLKFKLSQELNLDRLVSLSDNRMGVSAMTYSGKDRFLMVIDNENGTWEQGSKLETNSASFFYPSAGSYYFLYNNGTRLLGYDLKLDKYKELLTWADFGIEGLSVRDCMMDEEGKIHAICSTYDSQGNMGYELLLFERQKEGEPQEGKKIALTLGGINIGSDIREQVMRFNKGSEKYKIEIKDYGELTVGQDSAEAIKKLSVDLISGNVPDMLALGGLPWERYAAKGMFEDVYPFIDRDNGMEREDFLTNILKTAEIDGRLYQVVSCFNGATIAGSRSVLGNEPLSAVRMLDIIKSNPQASLPFGFGADYGSVFLLMLSANMDSYINWENSACSFDSDEFKALLELTGTIANIEGTQTQVMNEAQLLDEKLQLFTVTEFYPFFDIGYKKALFGDELCFKGFPAQDGGHSIAIFENALAMSSSCKDKEGAWEFLRTFLEEEYGKFMSFIPINKAAFEFKLDAAMEQQFKIEDDGTKTPNPQIRKPLLNGGVYEPMALSKEEAETVRSMIESIDKSAYLNESILAIINEELNAYLQGANSVDKAASLIQERMSLYIAEQN